MSRDQQRSICRVRLIKLIRITIPLKLMNCNFRCIGQIIGIQKLRLYDIQILEDSEKNHTQRAIFLSQRMTEVLNNRKSFA